MSVPQGDAGAVGILGRKAGEDVNSEAYLAYRIVSIHMRRRPGDRSYRVREKFRAPSITAACERLLEQKQPVAGGLVLRDSTGRRFSVADCRELLEATERGRSEQAGRDLDAFYAEQMRLARAATEAA